MAINKFTEILVRNQTVYGEAADYQAEYAQSGFFFVLFKLPQTVGAIIQEGIGRNDLFEPFDPGFVMSAAVESIDLPNGMTLNAATVPTAGLPSIVASKPTGDQTFSVTFKEYWGFIMNKIAYLWATAIYDPLTGHSKLPRWSRNEYTATVDVCIYDPTGTDVQLGLRLYGVFPQGPAFNAANPNQDSNEPVKATITFHVEKAVWHPSVEEGLKAVLQAQVEKLKQITPVYGT